MIIEKINIKNFRNLNSLEVDFNKNLNFIVGRNNIGKSNLLKLINKISKASNFNEFDFLDINREIDIRITLKLDDYELGLFDDYFDIQDSTKINLNISQQDPESELVVTEIFSNDEVPVRYLKRINYMYYDSMRKLETRGDILQGNNDFKVINHILNKEIADSDSNLITYSDESERVIERVNKYVRKIQPIRDNNLSISLDNSKQYEHLKRIARLTTDEGYGIENMGYGAQYSTMIPLNIINNLISKYRYKDAFNKMISTDEEGKNYINLIIGIDEPEIHLHPHLQRKSIKYIENILTGRNEEFNNLIKYLFDGLDYITGQLIVVTHSPYIILDDYKNFIRFYKDEGNTKAISGINLNNSDSSSISHLMKNMPNLKLCFFSKIVIFVEGDSELPAIKEFSKKMKIDLDDCEIEVVSAGSKDTIPILSKMYSDFGINSVSIIDRDNGNNKDGRYIKVNNVFFTDKKDFEEEILEKMNLLQFFKHSNYVSGKDYNLKGNFIKYLKNLGWEDRKDKLDLNIENFQSILKEIENNFSGAELKKIKQANHELLYKELQKNKSYINGYSMSTILESDQIPEIYRRAIMKAKELSID